MILLKKALILRGTSNVGGELVTSLSEDSVRALDSKL